MSVLTSIPKHETFVQMVRRNVGVLNDISKRSKVMDKTTGYDWLKSTLHVQMMECINMGKAENPKIIYNADYISMVSEQKLVSVLESLGYCVVTGDTEGLMGGHRGRYIEVLVDWGDKNG